MFVFRDFFRNAPKNSSKLKLVAFGSRLMLLLEISPLENRIFVLLPYKIFLTVTQADIWIILHKNEINEIDGGRSILANLEVKSLC
jgi:hypothetical protein